MENKYITQGEARKPNWFFEKMKIVKTNNIDQGKKKKRKNNNTENIKGGS